MIALVTGNTGYLGKNLSAYLINKGLTIFGCNTKNGNLTSTQNLSNLNLPKLDYIFHAACQLKAGEWPKSHQADLWQNNQLINLNTLTWWAQEQPQAKFIAIGSSCAYDPNYILKESNFLLGLPDSDVLSYGMTKRMTLIGLQSYSRQLGLKYSYLIPATIYGPGFDSNNSHFIFDLIRKIYHGKKTNTCVEVWGNGNQRRELIYIDDVSKAIFDLKDKDNEIYNIGPGEDYPIRYYVKLICDELDFDFNKIIFNGNKWSGVLSKRFDMTKTFTELNLELTPLALGIKNTIKYYLETKNG